MIVDAPRIDNHGVLLMFLGLLVGQLMVRCRSFLMILVFFLSFHFVWRVNGVEGFRGFSFSFQLRVLYLTKFIVQRLYDFIVQAFFRVFRVQELKLYVVCCIWYILWVTKQFALWGLVFYFFKYFWSLVSPFDMDLFLLY